jgi:hypothetical protein
MFERREAISLPDPDDTSDGLWPEARLPGIYKMRKEAFDTDVILESPDKNSYLFSWFECDKVLQRVLCIPESVRSRILDLLWNFYAINYSTITGKVWADRNTQSYDKELEL